METPGDHPFVVIVRALTQTLETELRRSFLRLAATLITLLTCTVILITTSITAVVVGIIHLCRGLITLAEMMIGPVWGAEMAVGALLVLIPFAVAAHSLRRSKRTDSDGA